MDREFIPPIVEPIPYESPPPLPRRLWPAVMAWVVIVTTVSTIVALHALSSRQDRKAKAIDDSGNELKMMCRYAIGSKSLMGTFGAPTTSQFLTQIKDRALTQKDQVRAIPVLVELGDAPDKAVGDFLNTGPKEPLKNDAKSLLEIYQRGSRNVGEGEKARLQKEYGWFAELALTHDLPSDSWQRRAVIYPAKRAAAVTLLMLPTGLIAILAGVVILIIAIMKMQARTLVTAYRPRVFAGGPYMVSTPAYLPAPVHPVRTTAYLEGFAIYIFLWLAIQLVAGLIFRQISLVWSVVLSLIPAVLGVIWPLLRGIRWSELRKALGWHMGRGLFHEIGAGVVGYIAGLPLLGLALLVTIVLTMAFGAKADPHPMFEEVSKGWKTVVGLYLMACVYAPIVEETLFRGLLFHHLRQRMGWILSASIVALIFAAIHPQGLMGIPVLGAIAMTLAAVREWRGSLIACMTTHALNNFVVTTVAVMSLS